MVQYDADDVYFAHGLQHAQPMENAQQVDLITALVDYAGIVYRDAELVDYAQIVWNAGIVDMNARYVDNTEGE